MNRQRMFVEAIACVLLSAVSGAAMGQASPPTPIKISAENAAFEWFFLIADAARDQGIWGKHGLDATLVPAAGSAAQLKEQVAGGIQLGWVNTAEALIARSQGAPVKVVAAHFGATIAKIYAAPESAIKTARDLDGKKVGILANTHTSYKAVMYLNDKLAIKAMPVALGNLASNVAALKEGRIDALYSAEGAALGYVDRGDLRIAVRLAEVYPNPYATVVIWTTEDLIREKPQVVAGFVNATLQAIAYLQANPRVASEWYAKRTGASKGVADRAVLELNGLLTSRGRGTGNDLAAAVAGNWQFTRDSGAVPADTRLRIEDVVETRFLP